LVFDVASDLVAPGASEPLTLRVWLGLDQQLDSRLVIRMPVDDSRVSRVQNVKISVPAVSAS
jgi:hypothetical protein